MVHQRATGREEIKNFFNNLKQGDIIWVKLSNNRSRRIQDKMFFAIFESYDEECGNCIISTGPPPSQMINMNNISEAGTEPLESFVTAMNSILRFSDYLYDRT